MSPIIIADSDDESDSNEHAVAAPLAIVPQAQTRSSERGSLATASTDSVFFQQVFNEQNDAACEKAQQLQRDLEDVPHQSSAMTIPDIPFQRTTGGFYHSSTTSVSDPHLEKFHNAPIKKSSKKRTERTQSAVDPWEVPSSPEAPKSLEMQSKGYGNKVPDQSYRRDESPAATNALSDGHWDVHETSESRDKKRRRLDESDVMFSKNNDVDLIMPPHSSKAITHDELETVAASSIPLPTMPVDAESAFYLRHTSPMESLAGFNMDPASNGVPKYNNLLLKQQTQYAVGSSGSATNVNTPRSQMFSLHNFSSMAPEEQGKETTTKKIEYRNFVTRRDSSPDIISALTPGLDKVASEPEYSPDLNPGPKPDQECCDERDSSAHQPPPQELQPGGNDAEFVAHPTPVAKSKRKRGRPKKPPETDGALPMKPVTSRVSAADAIAPAATMQKKKRGRPKKQSTEAAVESASPPAATPVSAVAAGRNTRSLIGQERDSTSGDGEDIQAATEKISVEGASEQGAAEEASRVTENTEHGQGWAAPGGRDKTKDHSVGRGIPNKSKDEDEPKEPRQPATREKEVKSGGDKKGSSAPGIAKPLYRVGLSKRSKIAPLLKSVRKP
ncbi:hypothetical protein ACHAQJ_004519 [Trichoderma viride]